VASLQRQGWAEVAAFCAGGSKRYLSVALTTHLLALEQASKQLQRCCCSACWQALCRSRSLLAFSRAGGRVWENEERLGCANTPGTLGPQSCCGGGVRGSRSTGRRDLRPSQSLSLALRSRDSPCVSPLWHRKHKTRISTQLHRKRRTCTSNPQWVESDLCGQKVSNKSRGSQMHRLTKNAGCAFL